MTFLDFFAGIGTIRIGFEQAGWTCNGHVEWDKFAQASYNAMHDIKEGEFCGWDIREVRADELPKSDLWAFGAPCQDFSIAGKRKGMDGERSSLIREIFRLIEETKEENRPTWLLYENVKGMLSSNGGRDFLGIITEMAELGYDVEWQLLNSKDWGVPQNRERVFTLGHFRGRGGRKVFPITGQGGQTNQAVIEPKVGIKQVGQLYGTEKEPNPQAGRVISPEGISQSLDSCSGGNRMPKIAIPCITPDRVEKRQNGRRFKEDGDPMFTLTAQDRHGVAIMRPKRTDYGKQIRKQYEAGEVEESRHNMTTLEPVFDGISNTITTVQKDNLLMVADEALRIAKNMRKNSDIEVTIKANGDIRPHRTDKRKSGISEFNLSYEGNESNTVTTSHQPKVYGESTEFRIRKLTPKECWRLQGIPDHYFDKASAVNSNSQLYKQAGNACTVNVIYEIAKRI